MKRWTRSSQVKRLFRQRKDASSVLDFSCCVPSIFIPTDTKYQLLTGFQLVKMAVVFNCVYARVVLLNYVPDSFLAYENNNSVSHLNSVRMIRIEI